jgi:phosphoglycerate dehydrogenase-like enzyme
MAAKTNVVCYGKTMRIEERLRAALDNDDRIHLSFLSGNEEGIDEALAEAAVLLVSPADGSSLQGVISKCINLQLLQTLTAGVDFLDEIQLPKDCAVCRTSSMTHSIAEYCMCAVLNWNIGYEQLNTEFKAEKFFKPPFMPPLRPFHMEVQGKTLGIVGYGEIGVQIAARANAFGMRVVGLASKARDCPAPLAWLDAGPQALARLLKESDFVVLACSLNAHTRGLIGKDQFACMKSSAVLINVARGHVAEEQALYEALRGRTIRGATLDVWYNYPTPGGAPVMPSTHPFHELDNCVMTPHASGWTEEQEERKVVQVRVKTMTVCWLVSRILVS